MNHNLQAISGYPNAFVVAGKSSGQDHYGRLQGGFRNGYTSNAMFNLPQGIAMDDKGTYYIADYANGAIRTVDTKGNVKTLVQDLQGPTGIAVGLQGEIYVIEALQHRILKVNQKGNWTVLAGGGYKVKNNEVIGAFADGRGKMAKFNEPRDLAIDAQGFLYVADAGNQRIRKVSPQGRVTTLAGSGKEKMAGTHYVQGGYLDGDGKKAKFNFPIGLAVGNDMTVYVADSLNHSIRAISKEGKVTTLVGSVVSGRADGIISQARLNLPSDVLLWEDDSLLIIDQGNALIRQYIPKATTTNK